MEIERVIVGELEENCYIVSKDGECLIIDPGSEFDKIKDKVGNREVLAVLVTHHHFDHVGALKEVVSYYKTNVYDFNNLVEKEYLIGPFKFKVIRNPGHTMDSVSFYFYDDKSMFVGDFVFLDSIGRCDLDGGNFSLMRESINKIKTYSNDIMLYPGHGSKTLLGYEKENNYYFN